MRRLARILGISLCSFVVPAADADAQAVNGAEARGKPKPATKATKRANAAVRAALPFNDQRDFENAKRGLMLYGPSFFDLYRRSASYVDKILRGANPGALPVERPIKFAFVINPKTAKELGLTIPPIVLYQATKVIR